MTSIAIPRNWNGSFAESVGSEGLLEVNAGVLRVNSPGGYNGRCYKGIRIPAAPGARIKVSVMAKRVSGSGGGIFLDYPSSASVKARTFVESEEWELHTLEFAAGIHGTDTSYFQVVFGNITASVGEYHFACPVIETFGGGQGYSRTAFASTIVVSNSLNASLATGFYQTGIDSVQYNADDKSVDVTISPMSMTSTGGRPVVMATLSSGSLAGQGRYDFEVRAGQVAADGLSFKIKFYNHELKQYVDPPTSGGDATYISVFGVTM